MRPLCINSTAQAAAALNCEVMQKTSQPSTGKSFRKASAAPQAGKTEQLIEEIRPGQSIELLKELHILTREGKLNQDTRRKLKQVYHLYQFIEPLLEEVSASDQRLHAGRPRRRQVLPGLHPVRPVFQVAHHGEKKRAHLRH